MVLTCCLCPAQSVDGGPQRPVVAFPLLGHHRAHGPLEDDCMGVVAGLVYVADLHELEGLRLQTHGSTR